MLNRLNALVVATLLGALFGAVAGAGFSLYEVLRWWTLLSPVPVMVATAKMGGVAGFTFALSLLAWFVGTRKLIGPVGGGVLGGVCALIGLQTYLIAYPILCPVGASAWQLYSLAALGTPFGILVGAAARSAPVDEGSRTAQIGSAPSPKVISPT